MIPLLVDLETEWRGGQNQFLLLLKGLHERGHPAELIAAEGSALGTRAASAGICVHSVSRGTFRLPAALKIRSLLGGKRFDLIHANESHALTAAWLARAHRHVPLVVSRRVGYPLTQSWIARRRFNAAASIIANCKWVADQAVASGAPREKVQVVYEGVEISALADPEVRRKAREHWGVAPDQPLLGCVGVLSPDKGHEFVIRAFAKLHREFPDTRLLFAGDGPCRKDLELLVASLDLHESVRFAGFVEDVETVYAALDLFLLPSLFEAFNNSLLAAMASAIPSIAFRQGGQSEIIQDGASGFLVQPENVRGLESAARKLLCDPGLAQRFASAGRRRVAENFSADIMVDRIARIYQDLPNISK